MCSVHECLSELIRTLSCTHAFNKNTSTMDNKTKTVRFAIQKPTIVNSVDPADTINKHISRKISLGYGASPRLIIAACGVSVFAAYLLNKWTKKPVPRTLSPEWQKATEEYSKKNHANYEPIRVHKIGSTDV